MAEPLMGHGAEQMARRGIDLAELSRWAKRELNLSPDDLLFLAGSMVEGLGNPTSDLDLHVIRSDPGPLTSRSPSLAFALGDSLVDLEIHGAAEMEELVGRLEQWSRTEGKLSECFRIAERERLHLHRLAHSVFLAGDARRFLDLKERVPRSLLAKHKLHWAVAWIQTLQVDLEGLRRAGDWQTMLPVATDCLGFTLDALLSAHLETNPTPKWRFTLLRRLGEEWERGIPGQPTGRSVLDAVTALYATGASLEARSAFERAFRIVAFARRIIPWAEAKLGGNIFEFPKTLAVAGNQPLGLHMHLGFREGEFRLWALGQKGQGLRMTAEVLHHLCSSDRLGAKEEAASLASEALRGMVRLGGFGLFPLMPEAELRRLLSTPKSDSQAPSGRGGLSVP